VHPRFLLFLIATLHKFFPTGATNPYLPGSRCCSQRRSPLFCRHLVLYGSSLSSASLRRSPKFIIAILCRRWGCAPQLGSVIFAETDLRDTKRWCPDAVDRPAGCIGVGASHVHDGMSPASLLPSHPGRLAIVIAFRRLRRLSIGWLTFGGGPNSIGCPPMRLPSDFCFSLIRVLDGINQSASGPFFLAATDAWISRCTIRDGFCEPEPMEFPR